MFTTYDKRESLSKQMLNLERRLALLDDIKLATRSRYNDQWRTASSLESARLHLCWAERETRDTEAELDELAEKQRALYAQL